MKVEISRCGAFMKFRVFPQRIELAVFRKKTKS
jgi:hypothetical protein